MILFEEWTVVMTQVVEGPGFDSLQEQNVYDSCLHVISTWKFGSPQKQQIIISEPVKKFSV